MLFHLNDHAALGVVGLGTGGLSIHALDSWTAFVVELLADLLGLGLAEGSA